VSDDNLLLVTISIEERRPTADGGSEPTGRIVHKRMAIHAVAYEGRGGAENEVGYLCKMKGREAFLDFVASGKP
jgi:hypothetical protein